MPKAIVTANHVVEITGGQMFGPGEEIPSFKTSDEHNAQLVEDGHVTLVETGKPEKAPEPEEKTK